MAKFRDKFVGRGWQAARIRVSCELFGGAPGESKARAFEVYGYAFMASRPA